MILGKVKSKKKILTTTITKSSYIEINLNLKEYLTTLCNGYLHKKKVGQNPPF